MVGLDCCVHNCQFAPKESDPLCISQNVWEDTTGREVLGNAEPVPGVVTATQPAPFPAFPVHEGTPQNRQEVLVSHSATEVRISHMKLLSSPNKMKDSLLSVYIDWIKEILMFGNSVCGRGYYRNRTDQNNDCETCPRGSYNDVEDAESCTSCPEGQTTYTQVTISIVQCHIGKKHYKLLTNFYIKIICTFYVHHI